MDCSSDRLTLIAAARQQTSETLADDYFPFTNEAVAALKAALGRDMTPRDITLKMTHSAGKAFNHNQLCVTSSMIS